MSMPIPNEPMTTPSGWRRATASNSESRVFAWSFAAVAMAPPMPVAASPTSAVTVLANAAMVSFRLVTSAQRRRSAAMSSRAETAAPEMFSFALAARRRRCGRSRISRAACSTPQGPYRPQPSSSRLLFLPTFPKWPESLWSTVKKIKPPPSAPSLIEINRKQAGAICCTALRTARRADCSISWASAFPNIILSHQHSDLMLDGNCRRKFDFSSKPVRAHLALLWSDFPYICMTGRK